MPEKTSRPAAVMIFVVLLTVMMPSAEAQTPSKPKPLPPAPASPAPQIKAPAMTSYVADTQQPVTKSGAVPTGAISWQCQGNRCQAGGPAATPTANACRALASQVGAMQSFAIGNQQLDAGGLMQCNAGLTAAVTKPSTPTTLDQMQKNMPGPKPGMVPDVSTKPEVWSQGKTGSAAVPAPKSMPGKPMGGFVPTDQSGQTALPAKSPSDPAKKSSGGFVPQQQSAAAPKPGTSDKKTKPSPGGPVTFTTAALTATGTGALAARLPFTAKSFSTATITATGTGAFPERLPFTPRSFSTTPLTATGTGSL